MPDSINNNKYPGMTTLYLNTIISGELTIINNKSNRNQLNHIDMNTTQTVEQMQRLKFNGMAAAYTTQLELPVHQQLESHELIAQLIQAETLSRNNERTALYLKLERL